MEFIVREDGLLTERTAQELASWYTAPDGEDAESFEAHLMLLYAHNSLLTSAQRGRRTGISRERYNVLRTLYRAEGHRMSLSELGRSLGVSPASVTKLMNALSRAHLARRVPFDNHKRRVWAELTPRGVAEVEQALPIVIESTRRRWQALSREEKRVLIHLLAKLMVSHRVSKAEQQVKALADAAASTARAESSLRVSRHRPVTRPPASGVQRARNPVTP